MVNCGNAFAWATISAAQRLHEDNNEDVDDPGPRHVRRISMQNLLNSMVRGSSTSMPKLVDTI